MSKGLAKISLGLPVYNGENYLARGLDSILAQTFEDFELIVSDNGSTDRTEEICRKYAEKDLRIKYFRFSKNRGATCNFNSTVDRATAPYFKWCSHDDELDSKYLEECLPLIENHSDVVLSHSKTMIIDSDSNLLHKENYPLSVSDDNPLKRFQDICVERHDCILVFGIYRTDMLRQSPMIKDYVGSDRVLLGHMALLGKIVESPKFLFSRRQHVETSTFIDQHQGRLQWFNPDLGGKLYMPNWRLFFEFLKLAGYSGGSLGQRIGIFIIALKHGVRRRKKLGEDFRQYARLSLRKSKFASWLYYSLKGLKGSR